MGLLRAKGEVKLEETKLKRRVSTETNWWRSQDVLGNAIFNATVPCFTHDFGMSQDYYQILAGWLIETKQTDDIPSLDACWTIICLLERHV